MHHNSVQSMGFLLPSIEPLDPGFHLGVFVGAVVVGDNMQRQILGSFAVELLQKR